MSESLKMQWFPSDAIVWTVRVDAPAGTMAVQVRGDAERSVGYYLLRLSDGSCGGRIEMGNGWWTELVAVVGQTLLIGRYGDPAIPVISEVMMVDGWTGTQLDASFIPDDPGEALVQLPSHASASIGTLEPPILVGSVLQRLDFGRYRVQAWHSRLGSGSALWLEIWQDSSKAFSTCLEQGMEKLNPSPFFLAGDWLVTVRNRTDLGWVRLGD